MNDKSLWLFLLGALVALAGALFVFTRDDSVEVISAKWDESGHADATSEAFTHWNEDDPAIIPTYCAKCHSTYGYHDFLGEDGTEFGVVNTPAMTGTVLYCNVCHNDSAHEMTSVVFPGGEEVTGLGYEAICMQCHQGRQATSTVNETLAGIGPDTVSETLSFINVHYYIAAATMVGTEGRVGFQYDGHDYVGYFDHEESVNVCYECHNPHSLEIDPDKCSPCHVGVSDFSDVRKIRESEPDYDGDGDAAEGIHYEITTMQDVLYAAIQTYAADVAGTPILYADSFPYFFVDTNANREADSDEVNFGNQYKSWTPRLMRAAYNFHFSHEDPGNFAHNARYVLQLLYDSTDSLDEQIETPIEDMIRPEPWE